MNRNTIIDLVQWIRVFIFTATLSVLLGSDVFNTVRVSDFLTNASLVTTISMSFMIAWLAPAVTYKFISEAWNKITPLKDKPTFIETEIVYLLSAVTSTTVALMLLLSIKLAFAFTVLLWVTIAVFPVVISGYLAHRVFLKTAHVDIEEVENTELQHAEISPQDSSGDFDHPNILAFFMASLVFMLTVSVLTTAVISFKAGFQIKVFTSIMTTSTFTLILLTIFGEAALNFGGKAQRLFGYTPLKSRLSVASAWTLGIMISTTFFIIIFGGNRLPSSIDAILASWHLIAAYLIITASCFISGIILSLFYKRKPVSAVFA